LFTSALVKHEKMEKGCEKKLKIIFLKLLSHINKPLKNLF
jgi:hypothetical protein